MQRANNTVKNWRNPAVMSLHPMFALIAAVIFPAIPAHAASQDETYPNKAIRLVVPVPPGGTPDIQARMLGEKLSQRLAQPVVIDNRGGGGGIVGMEIVARAPADGYTIVSATVGAWAVTPHFSKLPYDTQKDFAPIIQIATTSGVLVVHPSVAAKTVKDLIALARQKPGTLNYASGGMGGYSHVSAELFNSMAKVRMTGVQYKGAAPAMTEVMGGHTQVMFNTVITTLPHVKSGKLRALATTGATRLPSLPDLPTIAEAGVPGYENSSWTALGAPARTPRAIIDRLNREFATILQLPDIQEKHSAAGSIVSGGTPEQFRDYLKAELAKFGRLVTEAGLKGEAGA
jgi:tripartite-type tricarboxylate transporter receptor subunit TctC